MGKISVVAFVILIGLLSYFGYQSISGIVDTNRQPTESELITHSKLASSLLKENAAAYFPDQVPGLPEILVHYLGSDAAIKGSVFLYPQENESPYILVHALEPINIAIKYGVFERRAALEAGTTLPVLFSERGRVYSISGKRFDGNIVMVTVSDGEIPIIDR